jgi:hypothetical protein
MGLVEREPGPVGGGVPAEGRCVIEVQELHRFFEDWFNGRLANDEAEFERFAGVLSPAFERTVPDGETLDRAETLSRVRAAHAAHGGGMRIRVEEARARTLGEGMLEVTYEEWQDAEGEVRGRRSVALMRQSTTAPNGVEWVRLDETWIE